MHGSSSDRFGGGGELTGSGAVPFCTAKSCHSLAGLVQLTSNWPIRHNSKNLLLIVMDKILLYICQFLLLKHLDSMYVLTLWLVYFILKGVKTIMVDIDKFPKMAHFILSSYGWFIFWEIVRLHCIPKNRLQNSDCDTEFVSHFLVYSLKEAWNHASILALLIIHMLMVKLKLLLKLWEIFWEVLQARLFNGTLA